MTDAEALVELRIRWGERGFRFHNEYSSTFGVGFIKDDGFPHIAGSSISGWQGAFDAASLYKVSNLLPN